MMRSPFKAAEKSLTNLQSEVGSVLERLWRLGVTTGAIPGQEFTPLIELREEADRYVLVAEVPGVSLSLIEVTAGPSSVTLAGDKVKQVPAEMESAEPAYPRSLHDERHYGRFTRTVALPGAIRVDSVTASMSDGVLTIEMPKVAAPKPVEIRVEVSRPAPTPGTGDMTT